MTRSKFDKLQNMAVLFQAMFTVFVMTMLFATLLTGANVFPVIVAQIGLAGAVIFTVTCIALEIFEHKLVARSAEI